MNALLLVALLSQAPQQQAPPTFRSTVDVVEVDVRVIGRDGTFVADLKPQDFQLLEDGVAQKIQSVVLVQRSDAGRAAARIPPKPPADSRAAKADAPQVWLFLFDTTHLTPAGLKRTRDAVSQFIADKFYEGDIGGVIADGRMANNRLTSDRAELKKAVDEVKQPGDARNRMLEITREWPRFQDEFEIVRIAVDNDNDTLARVVQRACSEEPDQCRVPPDAQVREKALRLASEIRRDTLMTLNTIQGLSNGLARIAGPKSIVFITEGFTIDRMETELKQVVGQANRAGAHVYAIDARGLNKGSAGSQIIDQPIARSTVGATPAVDTADDGPNSLSVDTGGFAVRNENNFGRALEEIQADAGTYYVIAYLPSNTTFDGRYRGIAVKVDRPGVRLRARAGYLAVQPAKLLRVESRAAESASPPPPPPAPSPSPSPLPSVPGIPASVAVPRATAETIATLGGADAASHPGAAARGRAAYDRGDVATAARELGDASRESDARPWVFYLLGLSQFAQRSYEDAIAAWERVRRDAPEFETVYFQLADAYTLNRDDAASIAVLRDAEKRWPKDPEVLDAIGVVQVRRGALDAAIESFERAVAVAPGDGLAYYNLGRAYQLRMQKAQRYSREMEKWIGGEADRQKAARFYQKYIDVGGPLVDDAKAQLAALAWKQQP